MFYKYTCFYLTCIIDLPNELDNFVLSLLVSISITRKFYLIGSDYCKQLADIETMDVDPSKTQQYIDLLARQIAMEEKFEKFEGEIKNVKEQVAEHDEMIEEIDKTVKQTDEKVEVLGGDIDRVERAGELTKCRVDDLQGEFHHADFR